MKKIKITISVNSIYFSFSSSRVIENINKTSYIDTGNLMFEYDYLTNNLKIMNSFIKDIIKDTAINTLKIKNIELVPIVLKIVKDISKIKKLYILEDTPIDVKSFLAIVDNKNIDYINCYKMPGIEFNYINKRKDILIETRSEYKTISNFSKDNKLNKYSVIYYRKNLNINHFLTEEDLNDFEIFLTVNKGLRTINIKEYSFENINYIIELLKKYNRKPIKINIYQNKDNKEELFSDLNKLKLNKNHGIKFKIIYDDDFILNNIFKQLNVTVIRVSVLVILISAALILGITKYTAGKEDAKTDDIINDINDIVDAFDEGLSSSYEPLDEFDDTQMVEEENAITKKKNTKNVYQTKYEQIFAKLLEINPNTIGWLTVKNTEVDYPVVQYTDNDYYLKHSFDNKDNSRGWVFADYRNHFDNFDDNTIIYGHNLKSGYMFGSLQRSLDSSWYNNKDNLTIIFNTLNGNHNWQIFSIYTIEKNNDYLVSTFANKTNFKNYIKISKERSIIDFGVDVSYGDKILTLSTCYKDSNHRLIMQAKLVN